MIADDLLDIAPMGDARGFFIGNLAYLLERDGQITPESWQMAAEGAVKMAEEYSQR